MPTPPVAVVAKIIEVTVKTYGRGPLMVRGTLHSESPLHHFASSCQSEASLALLIAANPSALKATDFEGDPPLYNAYDNPAKVILEMLMSAETSDGLARILKLADEVQSDLGQAEAAVARYRAEVAAGPAPDLFHERLRDPERRRGSTKEAAKGW